MSTEKKSFRQVITSYPKSFWIASAMELFERWAWYGLFAVLALYLTGSTDEGALGFTHTEKGQIMGIVTAILYLLPYSKPSPQNKYHFMHLSHYKS